METKLTSIEQRLAKLISVPSVTADTVLNAELLADIERQLIRLGIQTKIIMRNEVASLIASFVDFDETQVWLAAHSDVVPGDPSDYVLTVRDQKLYGRGAYDMKFAIAAYLELAQEIASQKLPLGIIITSDEELGGPNGAPSVASQVDFSSSTLVLPDGGGQWTIERKAKGGLWLALRTTGKAAHASRPYLGINAIAPLVSAIHDLEKSLPHKDGTSFDDLTFVVGTIQGGMAMNQLAESAAASVDIRFGSSHTLGEVRSLVESVLARHPDVTNELIMQTDQHNNNLDHPDTQLLQACVTEIHGQPLEVIESNGGTDAPHFAAAGAHTIVFHPDGDGQHGKSEYISREGLQEFYDILKTFVVRRLAAGRQDANEPLA